MSTTANVTRQALGLGPLHVNQFERQSVFGEYQFLVLEVINLLQTTYLDPGIVSAESSLCATIH